MTDTKASAGKSDGQDAEAPAVKKDANVVVAERLSTQALAGIKSFEDAVRLAAAQHGGMVDSNELGDGFKIVDDKSKLVNTELVILEWEHGKHVQHGLEPFVIVRLVTKAGDKIIITDGSTGIKRQLETMLEVDGRRGGIYCQEGLRVSEYGVTKDGEVCELNSPDREKVGTTYYIA